MDNKEISEEEAAYRKQIRELLERIQRSLDAAMASTQREGEGKQQESKTDYEKVVEFFREHKNKAASAKMVMKATGVSRSSLAQIFYRTHKDSFVSGPVPGYTKKKWWALKKVALEAGVDEKHDRLPTLFGDEGDFAQLDAAECCFRILKEHRNVPMSVLTMTREALRRGYRARTRGHEDAILFATTKSFWARIGRDQRFKKVRPFVYALKDWPP
jgi:hypothetical protein